MTAKRKQKPDPERSRRIREGMRRGAHGRNEHTEPVDGCPLCPGYVTLGGGVLPAPGGKTDEQKDLEHRRALEEAAVADREAAVPIPAVPSDPDPDVVLHVLADGWTVLGKVFYRGEEIRLKRGTPTWELTVDREGRSWIDMDQAEQIRRYKEVKFAMGPWPFPTEAPTDEQAYESALADGDADALRRYEKAQQHQAKPKALASR